MIDAAFSTKKKIYTGDDDTGGEEEGRKFFKFTVSFFRDNKNEEAIKENCLTTLRSVKTLSVSASSTSSTLMVYRHTLKLDAVNGFRGMKMRWLKDPVCSGSPRLRALKRMSTNRANL